MKIKKELAKNKNEYNKYMGNLQVYVLKP